MIQAMAIGICRKHIEKNEKIHSKWAAALPSLEKLLCGGTAMLALDHILTGELTLSFPFLTALAKEGGETLVLKEIMTSGLLMCTLVTAIWAVYVLASLHQSADPVKETKQ